ncbi:MAG: Gx transporter family protein [Ruminococcus sp.]|nr:Gx transporter family protein [Ruminococcus sp.]
MKEKKQALRKINKLTMTALIIAAALVTFTIEAAIPPLTPIYGIKLGLSNVFTLVAIYLLGVKSGAMVLFIRITLGSLLAGQIMSYAYSFAGGLLSFLVMLILVKLIPQKQLWVSSAISAVFHNVGQIIVAIAFTQTIQIIYYLPVLIISGLITGAFTGFCATLVINKLNHFSNVTDK